MIADSLFQMNIQMPLLLTETVNNMPYNYNFTYLYSKTGNNSKKILK